MKISRRSFFRHIGGLAIIGGGVAVDPVKVAKPDVKIIERVRCSKCKQLYEDGVTECPTCKSEDNGERQIAQFGWWRVSGNAAPTGTAFIFNLPHTHTVGTLAEQGHAHLEG